MISPTRIALTTVALAATVLGLAACGGGKSSSAATPAGTTAASASASVSGSGRGAGFGQEFSDPKVQACLKAAGISLPTRSAGARPSGSAFPSGARPSGARPSGSGFPTGARPSGFGGGFRGDSAEGQKIQAALKACGIALPSRSAQPSGAAPTGSAVPSPTASG